MDKPKIIAFAGLARAGKTTAAKALADRLNDHELDDKWAEIVSFAAPLKNALKMLGIHKDDHPEQYRELAQTIGATMRAVDPDWWIKRFEDHVSGKMCDYLIIDDLRYTNEADWVVENDGITYFVDAGQRIDWPQIEMYKHESEVFAVAQTALIYTVSDTPCDSFSRVLDSNGTTEELVAQIKDLSV